METKKTDTENNRTWDEFWAKQHDKYYSTSRYTGD